MNDAPEIAASGAAEKKPKREIHLSKDGKWKSFPKVPNLLQYVSTGTYFARLKVDGKVIRQSLETLVFTTAKERLPDFLKERRSAPTVEGTFGEALQKYRQDLASDVVLSETSKRYRNYCIKRILKTWPKIESAKLSSITPDQCKSWASALSKVVDEQYFNNVLGTFRAIIRKSGLEGRSDPTREIKRLGVKPKTMVLPTPAQFQQLLRILEESSAWRAQEAADFVKFVAWSGCRLSEAQKVTWGDVDMQNGFIRVRNAKLRNSSNHAPTRKVPIIPEMRILLQDLKIKSQAAASIDRVLSFCRVERSLTNACKASGISRITHHDLRHLFATRAIQCGVDVATVSHWLGHKDGGALALKTYTHHQDGHSSEMALRVSFGNPQSGRS